MFKLTIAILLVHVLACQASVLHRKTKVGGIDALCADKSVDLTSLSELKSFSASAKDSQSCTEIVKNALADLESIIEQSATDLCSTEAIDNLRGYYAKYLDTSKTAEQHELLPKSLRRFALAYGLQTSNKCKHNMVQVLTNEGRNLLAPEDFEQLAKLIDDQGPVAQVLGSMGDTPDEVFLPGDLAPLLRKRGYEIKGVGEDKLYMQSNTAPFIRRLQAVCQRRFRPIYEPLMMPLTRLANLGFNYKDEPLKCELKCDATVREVGMWSRIVFLCESLTGIVVVEDAADKEVTEGTDTKVVRIITEEEAAVVNGGNFGLDGDEQLADIKPIVYQPLVHVTIGDEIYDSGDKKLKRAIKAFKTDRDEEETMRRRMVRKGLGMAKHQMLKGNVGLVFSTAYKGLMQKAGPIDSPAQAMVKSLNELVEQENNGQEGAVSYPFWFGMLFGTAVFIIALALIVGICVGIFFICSALG